MTGIGWYRLLAMKRSALLLGLVPILFQPGCGDDAVTADDFIASYPEAYCAFLWRCCDGSERSHNSRKSCAGDVRDSLTELLAFRGEATPRAEFLPDGAQGCLDKLNGGSCSDTVLKGGCLDDVTRALSAHGDPCRHSAECPSFYCIQAQKNALGSCGSTSVSGGNCSGDTRGCPLGTYCSSYRKCESQKSTGTTCSSSEQCKSGICTVTNHWCAGAGTTPLCDGV